MGLYEELAQIDVITPAMEHGVIAPGGSHYLSLDGKIRAKNPMGFHTDGPWINTKVSEDRNCQLWHHAYFNVYGIISRNCFNCWKVVCRPQTLEDLFKVQKIQEKKTAIPSTD